MTISKTCHTMIALCVTFSLFPSLANGQGSDDLSIYDLEGGNQSASFSGEAEWLAKQEDPKSHLHELPRLTSLKLSGHNFSAAELDYVATLKGVIRLELGMSYSVPDKMTAANFSRIGRMTWLESLTLNVKGLQGADWAPLSNLSSLKRLYIEGELNLSDPCLHYVSQIDSLERLDILLHNNQFSDDGVGKLRSLQRLEYLVLWSRLLTDKSLRSIAELRNLKDLRMDLSPQFTDEGIKSLAKLPQLEKLRIGGQLTAKSIEYLRPHRNLQRLSLDSIPEISVREMRIIAQFKDLNYLSLSGARMGDEELAVLKNNTTIKTLLISNARVTNRSLEVLKTLPQLKSILLRGDSESREIEDAIKKQIKMRKEKATAAGG